MIDNVLIDGSAKRWVASPALLRPVQSGFLFHYAFAMILGLVVLLAGLWWVVRI